MTPEERAAKIVADGQWIAADYFTDESGEECRKEEMNVTLLQREIAAAIREAVAEAVERAAQLCEARAAGVQDAIDEGGSTPALAELLNQFSSLAESIRAADVVRAAAPLK